MSSSKEPFDPAQHGQPVDTSEKLEINENPEENAADTIFESPQDLAAMLAEAQEKVASYHDQLLRAKAEVENVRRRAQDDVSKARKFGTESFAESLVPVKDSLEAALAQADQDVQSWKEGVQATLKQLVVAFERNQLKEVAPVSGDKFDPHAHQAISSLPSDVAEGCVITVLQKGYTIADRVLRPALVTVSSGQPAS